MQSKLIAATMMVVGMTLSAAYAADPAPNGIAYPTGWQNWQIVAPSYRTDNNTIRVVIGNDITVAAARAGNTNPWPNGAILGKVVWREGEVPGWPTAKGPGAFVHAEFMFKDTQKYAATRGWGWARWLAAEQRPYGANAEFSQECVTCHTPVANRDHVFTAPAVLPK